MEEIISIVEKYKEVFEKEEYKYITDTFSKIKFEGEEIHIYIPECVCCEDYHLCVSTEIQIQFCKNKEKLLCKFPLLNYIFDTSSTPSIILSEPIMKQDENFYDYIRTLKDLYYLFHKNLVCKTWISVSIVDYFFQNFSTSSDLDLVAAIKVFIKNIPGDVSFWLKHIEEIGKNICHCKEDYFCSNKDCINKEKTIINYPLSRLIYGLDVKGFIFETTIGDLPIYDMSKFFRFVCIEEDHNLQSIGILLFFNEIIKSRKNIEKCIEIRELIETLNRDFSIILEKLGVESPVEKWKELLI